MLDGGQQRVAKGLEAAGEVAQLKAASLQPRPQPSHIHLIGVRAELTFEQGTPDHLIDVAARPTGCPRRGGGALKPLPIRRDILQIKGKRAEAHPVERRQRRKAQNLERAIEIVAPPLPPLGRLLAAKEKLIRAPQVFRQFENRGVGGENVVVKAFEGPSPTLIAEARSETTGERRGFVERDLMPASGQVPCGGHSRQTSPNQRNLHQGTPLATSSGSLAASGGASACSVFKSAARAKSPQPMLCFTIK